jgi:hypothetical protein
VLFLSIVSLDGFSQGINFKFDENKKLYFDSNTSELCNSKYDWKDSISNDVFEYYMIEGKLVSTVHEFFSTKQKHIRSIDLNTGVEKLSILDSLYRQLYFKVSGWGNFVEVKFNNENGIPEFYCNRYDDNVSLEYLNNTGKIIKSYYFDLTKNKKYNFEGTSGFLGGSFITKYQSIKMIQDKNKIQLIPDQELLEMGLYEVGPRYEYMEDSKTGEKQLIYICYYKYGVIIKREVYTNKKLIKVENYE